MIYADQFWSLFAILIVHFFTNNLNIYDLFLTLLPQTPACFEVNILTRFQFILSHLIRHDIQVHTTIETLRLKTKTFARCER